MCSGSVAIGLEVGWASAKLVGPCWFSLRKKLFGPKIWWNVWEVVKHMYGSWFGAAAFAVVGCRAPVPAAAPIAAASANAPAVVPRTTRGRAGGGLTFVGPPRAGDPRGSGASRVGRV